MGETELTIITDPSLIDFHGSRYPSADQLAAFAPRQRPVKVRLERSAEAPRWLTYVIDRLEELNRLLVEPQGEIPVPYPEALGRAFGELTRFMGAYSPTPSVIPTADGSVQYVWHKGGWDVEVEVTTRQTYVWARRRDGQQGWDGNLDDRVRDLQELMTELGDPP